MDGRDLPASLVGLTDRIAGILALDDGALAPLVELERDWPYAELVAATRAALCRPVWELPSPGSVGLVTGSGGVALRTPNVSTAAALTASCVAGTRIVKPGSHASRSKQLGPGGLAQRLGLPIATSRDELARALDADCFAVVDADRLYAWAPQFELRTVGFFSEALDSSSLQPCSAGWKVNGVVDPDPSLHLDRCRAGHVARTLVVHGRTDRPDVVLDDASTCGTTELLTIERGSHRRDCFEPEAVGAPRASAAALRVPDAMTPEAVFVAILDGDAPRAWIDLVALSAGVILWHARAAGTIAAGYAQAHELLDGGVVAAKLRRMQKRE